MDYKKLKVNLRYGSMGIEDRIQLWPLLVDLEDKTGLPPDYETIDSQGIAQRLIKLLNDPTLLVEHSEVNGGLIQCSIEWYEAKEQIILTALHKHKQHKLHNNNSDNHNNLEGDNNIAYTSSYRILVRYLLYKFSNRMDVTYYTFSRILDHQSSLTRYYSIQNIHKRSYILSQTALTLLADYIPQTFAIAKKLNILAIEYIELFFTSFGMFVFPLTLLDQIMDAFFHEGDKILYRYFFALFDIYKHTIKEQRGFANAQEFWQMVYLHSRLVDLDYTNNHTNNHTNSKQPSVVSQNLPPTSSSATRSSLSSLLESLHPSYLVTVATVDTLVASYGQPPVSPPKEYTHEKIVAYTFEGEGQLLSSLLPFKKQKKKALLKSSHLASLHAQYSLAYDQMHNIDSGFMTRSLSIPTNDIIEQTHQMSLATFHRLLPDLLTTAQSEVLYKQVLPELLQTIPSDFWQIVYQASGGSSHHASNYAAIAASSAPADRGGSSSSSGSFGSGWSLSHLYASLLHNPMNACGPPYLFLFFLLPPYEDVILGCVYNDPLVVIGDKTVPSNRAGSGSINRIFRVVTSKADAIAATEADKSSPAIHAQVYPMMGLSSPTVDAANDNAVPERLNHNFLIASNDSLLFGLSHPSAENQQSTSSAFRLDAVDNMSKLLVGRSDTYNNPCLLSTMRDAGVDERGKDMSITALVKDIVVLSGGKKKRAY